MRHALYRDYRPRSFKELIGQDHVAKTLQHAIKSGRISHAYLFTGPRGVGKTSAARILAHEVNNLPYEGEATHLDIIEIDAASNRRIDEIRDLREKVRIAPSTGKYKVYIIDEVHMLTREAFNALLKTLEEPPAHSIFILATTEAHKLPETIISRTQRFEFKPIPKNQAVKHMQAIAKSEKIDITPGALELLAEFGSGSFRDSISLLDQLSTTGTSITEEDVRNILGIPAESAITEILDNVLSGNAKSILINVQGLKEQGVDAAAASAALSKLIRHKMVEGPAPASLSGLLKQLIETPASSHPYDHLEISLLESASQFSQPAVKTEPKNTPKSVPAAISPAKNIEQPAAKKQIVDISVWPQVIESARQRAASIYTALKLAEPEFSGDKLLLRFEFPLHQKKIEQSKNKALVAELVESLTGQKVIVECTVDKSAFSKRPAAKPSEDEPKTQLHSINNIFGAAEVVEA